MRPKTSKRRRDRLHLHRETLVMLQRSDLEQVVGAAPTKPVTCGDTCGATCEGCPPPP